MSLKSTVMKAELQLSDLDRNRYGTFPLTLAQHPSETDLRLMVRVLAFVLYADERLALGRGLSSEDEPDLWRRDYSGEIEQWIDLGQPDESRIRKACGRSREVVVVSYSGRSAAVWWEKQRGFLQRQKNLTLIDIDGAQAEALAGLVERSMRLTVMIQDAVVQVMSDAGSVEVTPRVLVGQWPDPPA